VAESGESLAAERGPGPSRAAGAAAVVVALVSLALVLGGMHRVVLGDSARSRLATVWSLHHHGTWRIDQPENPFAPHMVDKVKIDGRLLSTKPPLLPLAMAAEYELLYYTLGWDLRPEGDLKKVMQVMIATLMAGTWVLAVLAFHGLTGLFMTRPWPRVALLAAFAFGTQAPGFATQINNHTPAMALLLVAAWLGLAMGLGRVHAARWRLALCGCAGALVFTLDMPLTVFVAVLFAWCALRLGPRKTTWLILGALPVLLLHFADMWFVTGSLLPIQMRPELYFYENAYWRNPTGIDAFNEPRPSYLFHMTFGRYGSFLLFPVLLIGLAGWARACLPGTPHRAAVWAAGIAFAILSAYYALRTNNYGGAAYGFRWYIGAMPVLLLMGAPLLDRVRRPAAWAGLALLFAVSCYSAWECWQAPWGTGQEWTCRWFFGTGLP